MSGKMLSRGVRIVSENGIANHVKVTTECGAVLTGITGITILPMKKNQIIQAQITVLVSELDVFIKEAEAQPITEKDATNVD
jgi:hypothetical protein